MSLPAIYGESLMYIGCIILISLLVFWVILVIFRHRSLIVSIRMSNKNLSRRISLLVQLAISIGFAFCTIIILKQMYFLHHTADLGFSFKNRGAITLGSISWEDSRKVAFVSQLKAMPEILDVVDVKGIKNLMNFSFINSRIDSWDDKPDDAENINLQTVQVSPEYIAFYDFRLVVGEMMTDADSESFALLNESAVKAFGWHDPIGKQFGGRFSSRYTVKGIIKDINNFAPTIQANPTVYYKQYDSENWRVTGVDILFKYREGMWKTSREKIEQMLQKDFSGIYQQIINNEEEYDKFMKSENALIKLLTLVSVICVIICVFGFVSLVSLTCEERRKEIAIRKINGATAGDILAIFAKEYFLLLFIGAVIAFTTGYFIMQRWLEQYVKQTNIPAWIYLAIVLVLALMIVLCVGWQVYRASIENPADVVKSE